MFYYLTDGVLTLIYTTAPWLLSTSCFVVNLYTLWHPQRVNINTPKLVSGSCGVSGLCVFYLMELVKCLHLFVGCFSDFELSVEVSSILEKITLSSGLQLQNSGFHFIFSQFQPLCFCFDVYRSDSVMEASGVPGLFCTLSWHTFQLFLWTFQFLLECRTASLINQKQFFNTILIITPPDFISLMSP